MSGIRNLRLKSCAYSVVLQIFVRLEKFLQYSKKLSNDSVINKMVGFYDDYLNCFKQNVKDKNFSNFVDPTILYSTLEVNFNQNNVMEIINDFTKLYKDKLQSEYDGLYIDFKFFNAYSENEILKPFYSIGYSEDIDFNQNFINAVSFNNDFIISLPIIAIFDFQNPLDHLPLFDIELEDSLDSYKYKLKAIILNNAKHWAIAFIFEDIWYVFDDKNVEICIDICKIDDYLDIFQISGAIYIREAFYNDDSIFNNNLISNIFEDDTPLSSYKNVSDQSSQSFPSSQNSQNAFNFTPSNVDIEAYNEIVNYKNIQCRFGNIFYLPKIKFPIIENDRTDHFFIAFFKNHPFVYNYLKENEDIEFDRFLTDFNITEEDFIRFTEKYYYYNVLNPDYLEFAFSLSKKLQFDYDKNNISNNIFILWNTKKENLDERFVELLFYGNISILEFNFAKTLFTQNDFIQSLPAPIQSLEKIPKNIFKFDQRYENGFLSNYVNEIPDFIKNLDFTKSDYINQNLSLIFFGADIRYENLGLASGKLHGTTYSAIRRFNTGFILMASGSDKLTETMNEIKEDVLCLFNYLKINNPLYENFLIPISQINFNDWVFSTVDKFRSKNGILITNQDDNCDYLFKIVNGEKLIRVTVSTEEEKAKYLYVTFEEALALMFPVLFPNGPVPKINARTFRQKANILLSCKYFRIGLVACSMILYIYDIITRDENCTFQNCVKSTRVQKPNDETGEGTDIKISKNDPAFNLYWYNRNSEVSAMTEQFGPPDLMLTFTFNNKWDEVENFIDKNYIVYTDKKYRFEIQFSPIDEMIFWNDRFKEFKKNNFNDILEIMGFGKCIHYFWRLEFQGRGAPHVHCLIWLEKMLNIENIDKHMFANLPDKSCVKTHQKIEKFMTHHCSKENCYKNGNSCRFGFPKQPVIETRYNEEGFLELKRNKENGKTVDFCPLLILLTNAHTHVNILRSEEMPLGSPFGIHYVLKYNFKPEPNMVVQGQKISNKVRFKARVVSCEEAAARILSFSFSEKSIGSIYIDTVPPSLRTTYAAKNGKPKEMDIIEKYYSRPSYLDRLTILQFYSMYHISNVTDDKELENLIEPPDKNIIERPKKSLRIGSDWEFKNLSFDDSILKGLLYTSDKIPNAKRLKFHKLENPKIVTFANFDFNEQETNFYYHYLLISGCWRNEEEMMAGFDDPFDAIKYHGLVSPQIPDINPGIELYLMYHISYLRFDENRIKRMISNFVNQGTNIEKLLILLKTKLPEFVNPVKSRLLNSISYIEDLKTIILNENPISRKNFDFASDSIKKFITIDCSNEEIEQSKQLFETNYPLLNNDQKIIVDKIIQQNGIYKNYCILGKAGTGKTFMLNTLMAYFKANNIPFGVTASTGIASVLIKGRTLHSLFSLYTKNDDIYCGLTLSDIQGQAIIKMRYLFVDEVTMLSAKVFNVIDKKLRYLMTEKYGKKSDIPFGGIKLILTGDLAQVPAVLKNAFGDIEEAKNMFTSMNCFVSFEILFLRINQRQINANDDFIYLLNEVREHENGKLLSERSLDLLKSVFLEGGMNSTNIEKVYDFVENEGLVVFYTNKLLDAYNNDILSKKFGSNIECFDGLFIVKPDNSYLHGNGEKNLFNFRNASQKEISYMKSYLKKSSNLVPINLKIAIGCKVMLLKNIDTPKGLVNGRIGTILNIFKDEKNDNKTILVVKFNKLLDDDDEELTVEIIKQKICETELLNGSKIMFYQFPLKLCYGVTAHKVQGQTLKKVAINISLDAFAHGSFYVALSRVRNLKDVILFGPEEFPEKGPQFHNNGIIQTIGNEFLMMNNDQ